MWALIVPHFGSTYISVPYFFQIAFKVASSLTDVMVETTRRKHLAYLMADEGALLNPESAKNLPKQVRTYKNT